jgi:hypothetical protein
LVNLAADNAAKIPIDDLGLKYYPSGAIEPMPPPAEREPETDPPSMYAGALRIVEKNGGFWRNDT